ncbi:MAG: hypothetical protein IKK43_03305 [Clostridia bacterium]|nr:hypothetical protein [Clostridia bacterium]
MKNNKGVTLISVLIVLIVIIIIASVSIISGNTLLEESKEHVDEQEYTAVLDAVRRKKSEVSTSGILFPAGNSYVGIENPVVGRDASNVEQHAGKDWYLLEEAHLEELGIEGNKRTYIVNYKLEVVLLANDNYEEGSLYEKIRSYD